MKKKEDLLERRAAIVQAALQCFVDKGFHGTSMRDIAQVASVSLGNLYNHFASKEALIAEVATQEQAELLPLLQALEQDAHPSQAGVVRFLSAYRALCRQREWAVLSAECLAEIARTPALAPAFEASRRRLLDGLAGFMERGAGLGHFRPAVPVRLAAQLLLDAVESDALRAALYLVPQADAAPDESVDVLHPALLSCLLAGKADATHRGKRA
jgi:AcrR family transcriptional regulator